MSDETLKPCPFCGGEAETCHVTQLWEPRDSYWAKCKNCRISGTHHTTEAEAVAAWNSRAERTCRIAEYADAPFPVCSECGAVQPDDFTVYYCWNCGARVLRNTPKYSETDAKVVGE